MKNISGLLYSCGILLGACSSISTNFDYDAKADFASLKTYRWLSPPKTLHMNSLTGDRILDAVNAGLAAKGYRQVKANADFEVAVHGGSQDRVQVTDWGYTYGPRGTYWGGSRGVDVYQYREGTLILDIVDANTNKLIWRGTARKALDPNPTPEQRTKTISEAVENILKNFPPGK